MIAGKEGMWYTGKEETNARWNRTGRTGGTHGNALVAAEKRAIEEGFYVE